MWNCDCPSQPKDLTVNKAAKAFIQNQYNDWFSDQVARQLKRGNDPTTSTYSQSCQIWNHSTPVG